MRGTTSEVALLADVSEAQSAISSVYQCVTGPQWHEPSSLTLDVLDMVNKTLMARSLNLDDLLWITSQYVNLSIIMIFCSFLSIIYLIDIYAYQYTWFKTIGFLCLKKNSQDVC